MLLAFILLRIPGKVWEIMTFWIDQAVKPPLEGYIVKNIKRNVQQGFTLIELMIVIAIVAILVALAVPAYQDYTVRSKVAECVNSAAPLKLAVAEFRMSENAWPSAVQAGVVASSGESTFCDPWGYTPATGVIGINVDASVGVSGITATLTPGVQTNGIIVWDCKNTGGTTLAKYLPSTCRDT